MLAGTSATALPWTSGSPTSVPLSVSPPSAPTACPTWAPNIEALIRASIGSIWPIIAPRSMPAGTPGGSCEGSRLPICPRMAATIAALTPEATGSTRVRHTGIVWSTHSARLHALAATPGAVNWVTSSSHSPATWAASSTSRRAASPTLASPAALTVLRATSVASSALNGSSGEAESIALSWALIIPIAAGSSRSTPMALSASASWGLSAAPPSRLLSICWKSGSSGSGDWGDSESDTRGSLAS